MGYIIISISDHVAGVAGVPSVFSKDDGCIEVDKLSSKYSHFRETLFQQKEVAVVRRDRLPVAYVVTGLPPTH
jgi:hypothetical protein